MSFGRLRQRILLKCVPHVQHDYFPHLTNQIIVFWRCLCRCRRPCLSSLVMMTATAKITSLKKKTFTQLWLFCDHPILLAFYNVGGEPYNWIGLCAVKLNEKNSTLRVVCSSSHQIGKCGNFSLLFCRGWRRHVQHAYFYYYFFFNRPMKFLICGVFLAVPVVDAKAPYYLRRH